MATAISPARTCLEEAGCCFTEDLLAAKSLLFSHRRSQNRLEPRSNVFDREAAKPAHEINRISQVNSMAPPLTSVFVFTRYDIKSKDTFFDNATRGRIVSRFQFREGRFHLSLFLISRRVNVFPPHVSESTYYKQYTHLKYIAVDTFQHFLYKLIRLLSEFRCQPLHTMRLRLLN